MFSCNAGNHETTTCTTMYGFKGELQQKFDKPELRAVYAACKRFFSLLPLAACIGSATLVVHGGLFRKPNVPQSGKACYLTSSPPELLRRLSPHS